MKYQLLIPAGLILLLAAHFSPGLSYASGGGGDRGTPLVTNCDWLIASDDKAANNSDDAGSGAEDDEPDCD